MKALEINHTRIRIHPLALLTALAFIGMGQGLSVLMALLALSLHELAHVLAAKAFRIPVPEVEITPFGGVARMEDMSQATPFQQFMVAAAGPAMSWLCCLVCAGLLQLGWMAYLSLLAVVSVSLGVLNLLPLPVLDGGHLLYYAYEGLTRRSVSQRWQERLQQGGLVVIAMMMAIALYNDLARLLGQMH